MNTESKIYKLLNNLYNSNKILEDNKTSEKDLEMILRNTISEFNSRKNLIFYCS